MTAKRYNGDEGIDFNSFSKEEEIAYFAKKGESIRATGWTIWVRALVLPEEYKTPGGLITTKPVNEEVKNQGICGLVVSIGPVAYLDEKFHGEPWCKLGDWVVYPRQLATTTYFNNKLLAIVNDDAILGVIDDPRMLDKGLKQYC